MKIYGLTTEKTVLPLGIDEKKPVFSWKISGENVYQKNYRIKVATSEQKLKNEPDMWDSGIVNSKNNLNAEYNGAELKSCTRYFWQVIVNGESSEVAWFETAFLNPESEFLAQWIGQPLGFSGAVDDVRFDFTVDKPVKSARFYVAALGCGRFYLNGELLDDAYFDGAVSVYSKTVYYRTYELNLKQGKNALCAKIGYGFYGAKKMYGILRAEFEDGTISQTPTFVGRVWNIKKDAAILNGVYDGEVYDARKEEDWLNPDYEVTFGNWVAAFASDAPSGKFKANPIPPMRIVEKKQVVEVIRRKNGYLVDTGVNATGFLTVKAKGTKGESYSITHAEKLTPQGELDNANFRAAECNDKYFFKGDGEETYTPEFTYHAFRYAFIECSENVNVQEITFNHLRTDIEKSGDFTCSDKTLNDLHKIAVQTESNNLNGVYTDCPQRDERLGWLNDLTSRIYQSLCNFSNVRFLENFIDMITQTQNEKGIIPDTVPFEVGAEIGDFVSAYTVLGVLYYKWYGDCRVIERNYRGFKKWVEYIKRDADLNGGTCKYGIYGDWCPALIYAVSPQKDTYSKYVTPEFMSAAYFLWYLKHMKIMAAAIGKLDDAEKYERQFNFYKEKFNEKYYDGERRLYGGGSQPECAVMATVFCEDVELCARLCEKAAAEVEEKGYHITCGNQAYRHLIYNISDYGYAEIIYKFLVNKEYPSYAYMLEKGATSVWERWEDSVGSDMHSFNHPMFASYDGFFYNYVLGIRTEECEDAFAKIVVEPCFLKSLDYAEGYIDTVRGRISVQWRKNNTEITVKVQTPSNTDLVFRAKSFVVNGKEYRGKVLLNNGAFEITIHEDNGI